MKLKDLILIFKMGKPKQCYSRLIPIREIIDKEQILQVEQKVRIANELVREAYQFIKALVLFRCENGSELMEINRSMIKIVFSMITDKPKGGVKPDAELLKQLQEFYSEHYYKIQKERFKSVGKDILDEEIIQMITGIENHIKGHFYNYIKRLSSTYIPNTEKGFQAKRSKLISDLYNNTFKSEERFHVLIKRFGPEILQARTNLYEYPQKCLPLLFSINRELEIKEAKTFAFLPLRKSLPPCSIMLSKTICKEWFRDDKEMWDRVKARVDLLFNVKEGFTFSSLRTNGISCSLLFKSKKNVIEGEEKYIDELDSKKLNKLQDFNIVSGDPGKGNLIMLRDNHGNTLNYTAIQRRKETKSGKYRKLRLKREGHVWDLQEDLTSLQEYNSKTTYFNKFMLYLEQKNLFVQKHREHYNQKWYRKFSFNTKINSKRSVDNFLNTFEELYGPPSSTVLCVGDWEQRQGISFGKAPTMGAGVRSWFRKRGYQVYLVDEYRTSITCNKCKSENEYNFLKRPDPRPWKSENQKVWGLARCTNDLCRAVHNRDVNASCNLHEIASTYIFKQEPLECFKRGSRTSNHTSASGILTSEGNAAKRKPSTALKFKIIDV